MRELQDSDEAVTEEEEDGEDLAAAAEKRRRRDKELKYAAKECYPCSHTTK